MLKVGKPSGICVKGSFDPFTVIVEPGENYGSSRVGDAKGLPLEPSNVKAIATIGR